MILQAVTEDTIRLTREVLHGDQDLAKAGWSQPGSFPAGIQSFDLEPTARSLFPVITPLRNRIPRMSANGGVQANWKAFTGINVNNIDAGVSDGNRGPTVTSATADYFAAYRQIGLEDYVTWGAQLSAEGFLDLRARAATNLLWALMIAEEKLDLGGNTSLPLGRPAQPTVADLSTGGSLAANTQISVIVAPLSLQGLMSGSVGGGVRGAVTRANSDGSTDTYGGGTGIPSLARQVTTANDGSSTHSLSASTSAAAGVFGYAWFWGAPGAEVLGAITTTNSVVIAAAATGTQTAASLGAADNSTNPLVYDGILTQVAKTGAGYYAAMPTGAAGTGSGLTPDGAGGIVEIDVALQWFWDNFRLAPDTIWVSSQEQRNITAKILSGSNVAAQRFVINTDQGNVKGGDLVTSYLNKFTMAGAKSLSIQLHPNMPAGTIMFDTQSLPYPLADVPSILVKRCREDYRSMMWPPRSRRYEYGTYFDGVLQNYFPPAFGMITNIGNK